MRYRAKQYQTRILLALLVVGFLLCDGALNQLSMPAGNTQSGRQLFLAWIGILVAQPALLAIWAVLGPEPLLVRLPRAIFLVSLVSLAVTFGTWLNLAGRLDQDSLSLMLSILCQFTFLLPLLWLLRFFRNWRIVGATSAEDRGLGNRLSLVRLFVGQTLIVVLLAVGLFLFRDSWIEGSRGFSIETIGSVVVVGATFGFFSLPIVFLLRAALSPARRLWHALVALFFACLWFGAALMAIYLTGGKLGHAELTETLTIMVSFHLSTLVTLLLVRAMGFRLNGLVGENTVSASDTLQRVAPMAGGRFAIPAGVLGLLLLSMYPFAMGVRERRIAGAEERKWLNRGIKVSPSSDGGVSHASFLVGKPIQDDALAVLKKCPQLTSVNLGSSRVLDHHLERVGKLSRVETLVLNNTKVTRIGLQHLRDMQELRFLHLQLCPRVTATDVQELQVALPNCRIVYP